MGNNREASRYGLIAGAFAIFLVFGMPAFAAKNCRGLELVALSGYLDPLPEASFQLTSTFGSPPPVYSYRTDKAGRVCASIPQGSYVIQVGNTGFERKTIMHTVESLPDHFVMVLRSSRMEDPEPQKIRGKLTGVALSGDTWAVLSHVLGAERKFTRIHPDGTFEFTGFFAGHYQVQAVSREGPLACGGVLMHAGDGWVDLSPKTNCAKHK